MADDRRELGCLHRETELREREQLSLSLSLGENPVGGGSSGERVWVVEGKRADETTRPSGSSWLQAAAVAAAATSLFFPLFLSFGLDGSTRYPMGGGTRGPSFVSVRVETGSDPSS